MAQREYRGSRWQGIGAGVLLVAVGVGWYLLPGEWLAALRGWISGLGFTGIVIFAAIYVLGAVVLAPEALLTIAAGFAFGLWAVPIVLVAATIGASLAFLLAGYVARERILQLLENQHRIVAIDRAIAEDGWKVVGLLRLSRLIPFNLQNYLFGVTAIRFSHFVAATFVGIIPATALYTYLGALGSAAGGDPIRWMFFGAGSLATIVVVLLVTRKARAKLRQAGLDHWTT